MWQLMRFHTIVKFLGRNPTVNCGQAPISSNKQHTIILEQCYTLKSVEIQTESVMLGLTAWPAAYGTRQAIVNDNYAISQLVLDHVRLRHNAHNIITLESPNNNTFNHRAMQDINYRKFKNRLDVVFSLCKSIMV